MWLSGKDPAELDILELNGRALYPESIKRRNKKHRDVIESVAVRLRVPSTIDKANARIDALAWAQKIAKLPHRPTVPEAEATLGGAYFNELDDKCLLARCIFEHEPPHDPYLLAEFLDEVHEHASLLELWDRLSFWQSWEDVRVGELDEQKFLTIVAAIDRVRNLGPLVAIAGSARDSCVISMAVRLQSFLTPKSSSPSTES
jgi:hypothetical protein